jgi:hypothetical protein
MKKKKTANDQARPDPPIATMFVRLAFFYFPLLFFLKKMIDNRMVCHYAKKKKKIYIYIYALPVLESMTSDFSRELNSRDII